MSTLHIDIRHIMFFGKRMITIHVVCLEECLGMGQILSFQDFYILLVDYD